MISTGIKTKMYKEWYLMRAMITKGALSLAAAGLLTFPFASAVNAAGDPAVDGDGGMEVITESHGLVESEVSDRDGKDGGVSPAIESGKKAGGYWIRGKKRINLVAHVYSSYKHYTKQGHASVVNGNGDYKSGGWKPKYTFSTAKLVWTTWGTNKAYYNYK
ncbi:hypothetical protein SAMN05421790_10985 [Kroppenstedtia eburnea]|uniref:Bacteriocin (Lactococcin_972) n=2 Tax=Kroppenstedtia eburnea TaxID=714067 RepID=A0A1N7NL60_9BACL|nr:hypothetical protein SAMN05421790_10985 [Kroppenstedtia eburnea]